MLKSLNVLVILLLFLSQSQADQTSTPLESSGWSELTSYEQMVNYFERQVASSSKVKMTGIGTSVSDRSIPVLFFTDDPEFASQREKKPVVMIFCQQHGNEPSGKEAAMIVARRLLHEDADLLKKLDLILVPQVNPDGSEAGKRNNANEMDLNRNHVILSEPESNALHQLFLDWMPEVTLDVHEYNAVLARWVEEGYIKDADEMLGGVTNLNIDPAIMQFTREVFIPETGEGIEEDGFRFHRYIVGEPFEDKVVRYSTTAINDGRQSMGIYNTLSFIIEGKRYGNLSNEIEKRTKGQVSAIINFLRTVNRHAEQSLSIVTKARKAMAKQSQSHIQMDYFAVEDKPTLNFPVFDLNTWTHTHRDLESFKPQVKVKKSVTKPAAYSFAASEANLIELLKRHRVPMLTLNIDQQTTTESYQINHITDVVDEEKPSLLIDLEKTVLDETLAAGTIIVPVAGPASNLIPLMLEPESSWSIVTSRGAGKYRFKDYLAEGRPFPVKRLLSIDGLELQVMEAHKQEQ
jgi:hypothetical protein